MNPAEVTELYLTVCTVISVTSSVVTIIGNTIKAAKTPNETQNERIAKLEQTVQDLHGHMDNDNKRIKTIENGNRVTQQAILALMEDAINDGGNKDALVSAKDDLQKYLIQK